MKTALALAAVVLFASACRAGEAGSAAPQKDAATTAQERSTATAPGMQVAAIADMPTPRAAHSATRLSDGQVLLAGGCTADGCEEGISGDALLFDPATTTFAATGNLLQPRVGHRAIALQDGSVLLFGGWTADGATASVERYVPATGRFEAAGELLHARDGCSATLLADGTVLVAGGYAGSMQRMADAERFDPRTGRSVAVGALATARMAHTATLLPDGRVLVAGGSSDSHTALASLEIFDPATSHFTTAGTLARARHKHAAVALGDRVLLLGGAGFPEASDHYRDSEWWQGGTVSPGPAMTEVRYKFLDAVTALPGGDVLVAGSGRDAELLNADSGTFQPINVALGDKLAFATATPLADGRVLVAGGYDPRIRLSAKAWLVSRAPPQPDL
jgi:hypothetical protein